MRYILSPGQLSSFRREYGDNPQDDLGETEPLNARTGCIECPLMQKDAILERVIANP